MYRDITRENEQTVVEEIVWKIFTLLEKTSATTALDVHLAFEFECGDFRWE